ncbi:MAG: hypothetical protein ACRDQ0_13430, partial [Pseudonocardia sp.]
MANGYDSHSLKTTGLREAASSDMPVGMRTAVKDKRFTRNGIGFRTQQEADYPGGTASRKRGMDESQRPWETAQEATSPQIKPRATLEKSGLLEALPPWLQKKGEGDEEEQKEAAAEFVRENMSSFPCEDDARMALAVLSQFVDGDTLDDLQQAIEDQYGDPMAEPPVDDYEYGDPDEDEYSYMGESDLQEAPLNADKRNKLPDSAFALPGRKYPIDTPARARSALSRVEQFGSDEDKRKVRAA